MSTPVIHPLESINLRKIWRREDRDFTPWLAKNINQLGNALDLNLEDLRKEVSLKKAGRINLLARHTNTNDRIVIENQLGLSDNDHCLRLIGYASEIEAGTLIWIARDFRSYHLDILNWLNSTDQIDVYAVVPEAYQINSSYGVRFRTIVRPPLPQQDKPRRKTTLATICARRYTPIIEKLKKKGIRKIGRRGHTGRYRSFHTPHENIIYGTSYDIPRGQLLINLVFIKYQHAIYEKLIQRKDEIESQFKEPLRWQNKRKRITLTRDGAPHARAPKKEIASAEEWIITSLLQLRDVVMPHVDEIIDDESGATHHTDASSPSDPPDLPEHTPSPSTKDLHPVR